MKLREAEALGILNDHDARVRHVYPHLDDCRRHENVELARVEVRHDGFLLLAPELAVHKAASHFTKHARTEFCVDLLRRRQIERFALLDERTDDVGLPALFNLLAHEVIDAVAPVRRAHEGLDRHAPWRQMLDARDVEIAVDRQGHRAWNRRRRHDEHVGREVNALFERRSLFDAEAMLLVRHDEAERGEGDRLLNQGMRADHDIDIVRLDRLVRCLALLLRQSSCQEQQPHGQILQQFAELVEMLTRQDFRRCHECSLKAVFYRLDERQEGESRLARADVALHETAHRQGKLHVLPNVAPRLFLVLRQPKRQNLTHLARKAARAEMAHALLLFTTLAAQEQKPALDEVKFLENQPFPREM